MNSLMRSTCVCALSLGVVGCGSYVSEDEYFQSSLRPADQLHAYGYDEPVRVVEVRETQTADETDGGILITERGEDLSDDEWRERHENELHYGTPSTTLRSRIESLDREMVRLGVRADLRGPAARSTFEDHHRDYTLTKQMIAERVERMRAQPQTTDFERAEIEALMDEAEYTVQRARSAVASTPPQPR